MKDFKEVKKNTNEHKHLINRQIRELKVMLLDNNGVKIGELFTNEALRRAEDAQLDLVMLSKPDNGLAVCKILDYNAWQYHEKKKKEAQESKNKTHDLKELWISPAVGDSDLNIKIKKAQEFLKIGHKVRFTVKPTKGKRDQYRLMQNFQMLKELSNKILEGVAEVSSLENDLKITTGSNFSFTLKPEKKVIAQKPKM